MTVQNISKSRLKIGQVIVMSNYEGEINLDVLLGDIVPNLVTPQLDKVTAIPNNKKPKLIAEMIITGLADTITDPVNKEIVHDGDIHHIRFVNVEPLLHGSWAIISLMLLSLSYGEQSTIIEAIYPKRLQLNAKAFAVVFSSDLKQRSVTVKQDEEIVKKVDSANAGIAMILALMERTSSNGSIPHADEISKNQRSMTGLVDTLNERNKYKNQFESSQEANKHRDGLGR